MKGRGKLTGIHFMMAMNVCAVHTDNHIIDYRQGAEDTAVVRHEEVLRGPIFSEHQTQFAIAGGDDVIVTVGQGICGFFGFCIARVVRGGYGK